MKQEREQQLDQKTSNHYGVSFSTQEESWVYADRKTSRDAIEIPHADNIDEVIEGANKVSFVENKVDEKLDIKLVVDREYPKPDQKGSYSVREVYGMKAGKWEAEATFIDVPSFQGQLVDRIGQAASDSKVDSIRAHLGESFYAKYAEASVLKRSERNTLPEWKDLYRFAPKHSSLRVMENVEISNPTARFKDEQGAFELRFGEAALADYQRSKEAPYNFSAEKLEGRRDPKGLPGTEIIRRSGPWSEKDDFYRVSWSDQERSKFVYVSPQHNKKNGFSFDFLEVYVPQYDAEGHIKDFSIEYLYYKPDGTSEVTTLPRCYVIEQDFGRTKVTQVLRRVAEEGGRKGDFENMLVLFEDSESGKSLNVNALYPELRIVSTHQGMRGVLGSTGNPAYPIMNIGLVTSDYAKLIGHEETHFDTYHQALRDGVDASVVSRTESHPFYLTYVLTAEGLPFIVSSVNSTSQPFHDNPGWAWGFYGVFLLGGNIVFGEMPYKHVLTEEAAENGARMFVLAAREHGVDLLNGAPQGSVRFAPDTLLWKTLNGGSWILTRPSLLVPKRRV